MTLVQNEVSVPVFEIDQPATYGKYLIRNRAEILVHLRALLKHHTLITVYLGDGQAFFLSTLLSLDEQAGQLVLDGSNHAASNDAALKATRITLTAPLERVKIQIRLNGLALASIDGKKALFAPLPDSILRLQRREFFRVEMPHLTPLRCKLAVTNPAGGQSVVDYPLFDLSGGGLCLLGPIGDADLFSLGTLFHDCRLEIPGEGVLSVNLRVCEVLKTEMINGEQQLRLGCEFVSLPGTRLAFIERYITRQERERKLRSSGLN
ncbi:MAG: flagellar brake protein [Betaproteobacteria bacterium HGW-Betaproteobacteria-5]|jgi:c-di-GMP-binding flagellar brake protein YcgR|nr:MAG: flagellar brake protein [Betaproteobacteria bacterium HGW-Betaproteobacteria-5]PKO41306.1 MAG: flagellar brake protein [Betaproteobacteria bacterium HGW-Betaproteobacteria-6]